MSEKELERELFYWRIYRSKYCKESSIYNLKHEYSMPQLLKLYNLVEMQEAMDYAVMLDSDNSQPKTKGR